MNVNDIPGKWNLRSNAQMISGLGDFNDISNNDGFKNIRNFNGHGRF